LGDRVTAFGWLALTLERKRGAFAFERGRQPIRAKTQRADRAVLAQLVDADFVRERLGGRAARAQVQRRPWLFAGDVHAIEE